MSHPKGFSAGIDEFTFQSLFWGKRNRMEEEVQFSKFLSDLRKNSRDIGILRHVARHEKCIAAKGAGEFLDIFFEAFPLIREGQFSARFGPGLSNGPGDRALIGDTKHNP